MAIRHLSRHIFIKNHLKLIDFFAAIAFFEHVNLLYGAVSEYCTPAACPDMLGPGQRCVLVVLF